MLGLLLIACHTLPDDCSSALKIWPAPKELACGAVSRVLSSTFAFSFEGKQTDTPDTLAQAFIRYAPLTRPHRSASVTETHALQRLQVSVKDVDEAAPQSGTDESYELKISDVVSAATLTSATVYGALRGLETFSQIVQFSFNTSTYHIPRAPLTIKDEPRFVHRGFMVDTARHFQVDTAAIRYKHAV